MANLWLDISLPDLVQGCCVDRVYALVFDRLHRALKDNGSGVLIPTAYVKAQHSTFALILSEQSERSKYYFLNLDSTQFSLPANLRGETYQVEYWRRELTGAYNRDQDILEETRPLRWSGNNQVAAELSLEGVNEIVEHESHVSASYDSETLILYLMAHLERAGALVEDALEMNARLLTSAGVEVFNVTQNTYLANAPGIFNWEQSNLNLEHDRIYTVLVTITDAAGIQHKTVSYLNAWD